LYLRVCAFVPLVQVAPKRWKVDIGARHDAVLMLSSVNLSGGVQRRRTLEDALSMRSFLQEGDLISVRFCMRTRGRASSSRRVLVAVAGDGLMCVFLWLQADVHSVQSDGSLALHARSLQYGKVCACWCLCACVCVCVCVCF
jgi:exosome complex RNA-binding protein Rrp4